MSKPHARFLEGSIMRHVVHMTMTGALGLVAIFLVDAINLFYISRFGTLAMTAAIGFASTVLFLLTSVSIGLVIAGTAVVSRALGAGQREEAKHLATSSLSWNFALISVVIVLILLFNGQILHSMGASGEVYALATRYLWIVAPSTLFLAVGMMYSGTLRAVGDGRRAMWVTLGGGLMTAVLDPILIVWLGLGLDGAAIAVILMRISMALIGYYGVVKVHRLSAPATLARMMADRSTIFKIALPAILTNIATPIGLAISVAVFSQLGAEVVAGMTVADRLVPLCFGVFFALTGAVGPIIGQNLGAKNYPRVERTVRDSLFFIAAYSVIMCLILAVFAENIADLFGVHGEARRFVIFFCHYGSIGFSFTGVLFTANAAFNNLGFPLYATAFNWGRALIANGLAAYVGFQWFKGEARLEGAYGLSLVIGALFSVAAVVVCFRVIGKIGATRQV